jgi:hypothetical protein
MYCARISPEEYNKEKNNYTEEEPSKLTMLTRPFKKEKPLDIACDSDDESSESEQDSESLAIYKKQQEIDDLESKNHHKTLEMTNLTVENIDLKKKNTELTLKYINLAKLDVFIQRYIAYKNDTNLNNMNLSYYINLDNVNASDLIKYMVILDKKYNENKTKISDLINLLKQGNFHSSIMTYYSTELHTTDNIIENIYKTNNTKYNNYLRKLSHFEYNLYKYITMLFGIFFLFIYIYFVKNLF